MNITLSRMALDAGNSGRVEVKGRDFPRMFIAGMRNLGMPRGGGVRDVRSTQRTPGLIKNSCG
jgi:hypothetical protein